MLSKQGVRFQNAPIRHAASTLHVWRQYHLHFHECLILSNPSQMTQQLNTVLSYLRHRSGHRVKSKSYMLKHLNIPRSQFDAAIKQLNRDGYINIFMRSLGKQKNISTDLWDQAIVFELSSRGKVFQQKGGYDEAVHHKAPMKSAVGF